MAEPAVLTGVVAGRAAWNPVQHPRVPGGKHGGEFTRHPAAGGPGTTPAAAQADKAHSEAGRLEAQIRDFTTRTAGEVPRLLGGGKETWDGTVTVTPDLGERYGGTVLAQVQWGGHMDILESVAKGIDADLAGRGEMHSMDSFSVPVHEMIHTLTGGREQAQEARHAVSGRSQADDTVLSAWRNHDYDSADQGVHTWALSEINRIRGERNQITQAQVDSLVQRGYLKVADIRTWNDKTGGWEHLYSRTSKALSTDPFLWPPGPNETDREAYQNAGAQAIEEGFTELGTIQHAAGYFDAMGLGKRPTPMVAIRGGHAVDNPVHARRAKAMRDAFTAQAAQIQARRDGPAETGRLNSTANLDDLERAMTRAANDVDIGDYLGAAEEISRLQHSGDPVFTRDAERLATQLADVVATPQAKHTTLAEYARRLDDHQRIVGGKAWGHYPDWTRQALYWCEEVAKAEGHRGGGIARRVHELADEINREGAAGKLAVMAEQVLRAAKRDLTKSPRPERDAMGFQIRRRWLADGAVAAYQDVAKDAREMAGVYG